MLRPPKTDFWQVGVLPAAAETLVDPRTLSTLRDRVAWMPDPGPWRYLADPFGVVRAGTTHVFVEAFDYHTKHAVIEHHVLAADGAWGGGEVVLAAPVHLSYPFIVEQSGEVFMIPESHKAREVVLYRARAFPGEWVRETVLLANTPAAEPSIIEHEGTWWMFFTVVGPKAQDQRELHLAFADRLAGPWTVHPLNPILVDRAGARPGGTPFVGQDGRVVLPVQDCSETYGGALRFLSFEILDRRHVRATHLPARLTGDLLSPVHPDGFHTFARCGGSTLVDVKRISRSWARTGVNFRRRLRPKTRSD